MSNMTIKAKYGRLTVMGYQPEVSRIYWSELPTLLPTYGRPLNLDGCEIKAIYADGSEAVVTDYCTFSPDTGATVPDEKTMTVTATYTARSGKVCQADEILPVCIPSYIKIIVPETVQTVHEGAITYDRTSPDYEYKTSYEYYSSFFGFPQLETWLYWLRDDQIVKIQKVDASLYPNGYWGSSGNQGNCGVGHKLTSQTYTRYFTPTRFEEVTYEYTFQVIASFTVYGKTMTDKAYLKADIVDAVVLKNVPTSYEPGQRITLTKKDNVMVRYKSGDILEPSAVTQNGCGFWSWGYPDTWTVTFNDDQSGSVPLAFETFPAMLRNSASYSCADGKITWTNVV